MDTKKLQKKYLPLTEAAYYVLISLNKPRHGYGIMQHVNEICVRSDFKIFPSVRFEYFLSLLKHASFIIGNSSAGIREAPYYGVPTINVGTRQNGRTKNGDIIHSGYSKNDIVKGIQKALHQKRVRLQNHFGEGNSANLFYNIVKETSFWKTKKQKAFREVFVPVEV